jgi:glutamate synthase domain-containing protein 2
MPGAKVTFFKVSGVNAGTGKSAAVHLTSSGSFWLLGILPSIDLVPIVPR